MQLLAAAGTQQAVRHCTSCRALSESSSGHLLHQALSNLSCRLPLGVTASQYQSQSVSNSVSGVISTFTGYGLNNPTVISYVPCTASACVGTSNQTNDWIFTMTFAYATGVSFSGLVADWLSANTFASLQVTQAHPWQCERARLD